MILKEHKKHNDLSRPAYGNFHRNEWAIVGGQCNAIKAMADEAIQSLPQYKCAYVDAQHVSDNEEAALPNHLNNGAVTSYIDHINYKQFNFTKAFNHFSYRQIFNDADMVLINGNHFEAKSQIVIIDESKKASLKKRVSQLTNVELILLDESATEVFDFIKEALPSGEKLPIYKLSETNTIVEFLKKKLDESLPILNGLVLAGGKSIRMGNDKGLIKWHGKEQQYYVADILKTLCNETYISCRAEQQQEIDNHYQTIPDTFTGLGPYGAILSAFREKPDAAWLVVACDLPMLNIETLQHLIDNRNPSSMATSYESTYNHFPEPLITIWEPKSYPVLLSLLSQGYNCPGKALRNMDTNIIQSNNPQELSNVNTREEFEEMQNILQKKLSVNDGT
ncbi:MAG: NTP transferase domain-containing protein [Ginsengibacter sp.]